MEYDDKPIVIVQLTAINIKIIIIIIVKNIKVGTYKPPILLQHL